MAFCDAKPGNKSVENFVCQFFRFSRWEEGRVKQIPFYSGSGLNGIHFTSKTDFCLCQMFSFFRYYETNRPVMVVSDVEVIKQVLVKEFSKFNIRKVWAYE